MRKEINCPNCHKTLDEVFEVNIDSGYAKCKDCHIEIDLNTSQSKSRNYIKEKLHFVDTTQFDVKRIGGGVEISFKWKSNWFLVFFATFWNAITFTVLGAFMFKDGVGILKSPAGILAFTHPSVGIATAYIALSSLINKTKITIKFDKITITSFPIPWPFRNKTIRRNEINQLYVLSYSPYTQNGVPVIRYKIMAKTHRSHVELIKGIADYSKAVSIELEIEKELNIKDEKIKEEHLN